MRENPVKREAKSEQDNDPDPPVTAFLHWSGRIPGRRARRRNVRSRRLLVHFSLVTSFKLRGFPEAAAPSRFQCGSGRCGYSSLTPYWSRHDLANLDLRTGCCRLKFHTKLHIIKYFLYDGPQHGIVAVPGAFSGRLSPHIALCYLPDRRRPGACLHPAFALAPGSPESGTAASPPPDNWLTRISAAAASIWPLISAPASSMSPVI